MTTTALMFFPKPYVGFNKTQLLERQLAAEGVIGSKLKSTSVFSMGPNFRQFIPKVESIYKFQYGMIRIQILAVGVWTTATGNLKVDEYSNVVLIEGETVGYPLDRYIPFCELLFCITGDEYQVGVAHEPFPGGIAEKRENYLIDMCTT